MDGPDSATITYNGLYPEEITLLEGSEQEFPIEAYSGETVSITWTEGDYSEDVSFSIIDANGNSIYDGVFGDAIDETLLEDCTFGIEEPTELTYNCVENSCQNFRW